MWHRLQILVTKSQQIWLAAESKTKGISIGEVIRRLIDREMASRRQKGK